jgi:hypothetical protein
MCGSKQRAATGTTVSEQTAVSIALL